MWHNIGHRQAVKTYLFLRVFNYTAKYTFFFYIRSNNSFIGVFLHSCINLRTLDNSNFRRLNTFMVEYLICVVTFVFTVQED
jgi:hypothetical protein